jgi:cysteinyl-tRNA synthetase
MLHIYNTLSQKKELFTPIKPGYVDLYVCGPTVYDYCHVGHARVYLAFDMISRYFKDIGYQVRYVRNITDIDDKIIKRAEENQETMESLTERMIEAMSLDFQQLNLLPPAIEPRATHYIQPIIDLIKELIAKGFAYVGKTNDVYYEVGKFSSYGCLSHRELNELQSGIRVDVNEAKRNPLDFVLWKTAKPGEPSWESPWGLGRPGWHIECSAMSLKNLGETFDIHGGGPDLMFPHHENERAQSEAATGKAFVHYWMHVGYVNKGQEKMSKSLGNFLTIRDFLKHHQPEVLRYFSINSHYRSPIEFSDAQIHLSIQGLERFYTTLRGLSLNVAEGNSAPFEPAFRAAMEDDFNTPAALACLFDLAREINRVREANIEEANRLGALLKRLGNILGLFYQSPEDFLQNLQGKTIAAEVIEDLIEQRNRARIAKDWAEADKIRQTLLAAGIVLEDTPQRTVWQVVGLG